MEEFPLFRGEDGWHRVPTAILVLLCGLSAGAGTAQAQPGVSNWLVVEPMPPLGPEEPCDVKAIASGFYQPVPFFVEANSEGRLIWPLRDAAKTTAIKARRRRTHPRMARTCKPTIKVRRR